MTTEDSFPVGKVHDVEAFFIDGEPIPPGYIKRVTVMTNEVCDIEEAMPWGIEL